VHVLSGIREVLAAVFGEEGVRYTRLPLQALSREQHLWVPDTLRAFNATVVEDARQSASVFAKEKIKTCQGFVGLCTMGEMGSEERVLEDLARAAEGLKEGDCVEWMVHPGQSCKHNHGDEFNASKEREFEMELLCSESLKRRIIEMGFSL
jgi:hypothetical protein